MIATFLGEVVEVYRFVFSSRATPTIGGGARQTCDSSAATQIDDICAEEAIDSRIVVN